MATAFVQVFNVLALDAIGRGLTPTQYGVVMGLNGVLIILFEIPLNQWAARFDLRRVLVVGFITTGLGCMAFGPAVTQMGFFAAMTLFTFGEMLSLPVGMGYASMLAPEALRGRYFGVNGLVWSVAGLMGSSGVWFYGQLGASWWYVAGGIGTLGGVVMLFGNRDQRPGV